MAITVNTNVTAMGAQRNLTQSSNALATSMERLSTGSRINSAKDDAAGLQISNRLNSQVRGLGVAMKNANDGISLAQTAEGAMQESTNILQRMRDLSLQAANDTNSQDDRDAMQKEVSDLQTELTRIAESTSFGGQKLLDGTFGTKNFQIGANANETVSLSLTGIGAESLGETQGKAAVFDGSDYTALGDADETLTFTITIDGEEEELVIEVAKGDSHDSVIEAINAGGNKFGLHATKDASGDMLLVASNENIVVNAKSSIAGDDGTFLTAGEDADDLTAAADATITGAISTVDISTYGGAQTAIGSIDSAIKQIDDQRSTLGSFQNRMGSTINNLANIQENVAAGMSRIKDVDFAQETVNLTKQQILQQAGTSILAQAKQIPQAALSLLG